MNEQAAMTEAIETLQTLVLKYKAEDDRAYRIECLENDIYDIKTAFESFKESIEDVLENH